MCVSYYSQPGAQLSNDRNMFLKFTVRYLHKQNHF